MKVIPLEYATDHQVSTYGIMFESEFVYDISGQSQNRYYPHRFKVWSNVNRPGTDGVHKYTDPKGKGTDDSGSFTLGAEASVISAHGNGTGSKASGQVWGQAVAVGDTVILRTPAGYEYGPFTVDFHRWNGLSLTPTEA